MITVIIFLVWGQITMGTMIKIKEVELTISHMELLGNVIICEK